MLNRLKHEKDHISNFENEQVGSLNHVQRMNNKHGNGRKDVFRSKIYRFFHTTHTFKIDYKKKTISKKESICNAFKVFRNKIETLSRDLKKSPRTRLEETESPDKCKTPNSNTDTRDILGRTPIKLYSPFAIETPVSIRESVVTPYNQREKLNKIRRSLVKKEPNKKFEFFNLPRFSKNYSKL